MNYLYISLDAIEEFASNHFFQSADYEQCSELCSILKQRETSWSYPKVHFKSTETGGSFFYCESIDKKRGILFDFTTFKGFQNVADDKIITIFQKTLKFAIKYYSKLPLLNCERTVNDKLALVFPFPFTATRSVDKVFIDTNSSSLNRNEQNYLTVFHFGCDENSKPSFDQLNKAVEELNRIDFTVPEETKAIQLPSFYSGHLENRELTIDSHIGFKEWENYLTKSQKEFIYRDVISAERLEGAAGSGKTISMILRCIYLLTQLDEKELHLIFVTHSMPTKDRILEIFRSNYPEIDDFLETKEKKPLRSLLVTTLQEWSANNLGTNYIADTEYLDKDAESSKQFQNLYIQQALEFIRENKWAGYSVLCSQELIKFIETVNENTLLEMLRYEISVIIKGRAKNSLDVYLELERPLLSLPLKTAEDRRFIFDIFLEYQNSLEKVGLFDTDDITITALGQIDTPIWKRRNQRDGYDVCFVDETHLFNFNELSIFHLLNKPDKSSHIVFAIDKSQSYYEVGFSDDDVNEMLCDNQNVKFKLNTIFRSSPYIVNLAFDVLSSNSAIFTNFDNPLEMCSNSFTKEEENKCSNPEYLLCESDEEIIRVAFEKVETLVKEKGVSRSDILIIATTEEILKIAEKYTNNLPWSAITIQSRNDMKAINSAINNHRPVLGLIDYVGGLEFDSVIIIGVDKGRVPPEDKYSSQYMSYAWHNRMYVAITRAKYSIHLVGNKMKGISPVIQNSIENKFVDLIEI